MDRETINIIHMAAVAPILVMIGVMGKKTPNLFFKLLIALGLGVLGYHLYLYLKVTGKV